MNTTGSRFETTSWTLVRAAGGPPDDSHQALAELYQRYWSPVYTFIRHSGYNAEQAQDLAQGFFVLLIEKNYLKSPDPERGRFRSFLLTAVKHFLANEWDRARAIKRGRGQIPDSIDLAAAEDWHEPAVESITPETLFERRWALSLLERVMNRLRAEYTEAGRSEEWAGLSGLLSREAEAGSYAVVAERLGLSPGALRMSVHRLRKRYRRLLHEEIEGTVSGPEEVDDELRFLLSTLTS